MTPDLKAILLNAIQQAASDNAELLGFVLGVRVLIFTFEKIKQHIQLQTYYAENDIDERMRK